MLLIFDLDGVLIDSKEAHKNALNRALKEVSGFQLTEEEHLSKFDGMPTVKKLEILVKEGRINPIHRNVINELKKQYTSEFVEKIQPNLELQQLFSELNSKYSIAVCSNAISSFVHKVLYKLGIRDFIHYIQGNEEVKPKPHPHPYIKIMANLGFAPDETIIFEDSPVGKESAIRAGGFVVHIDNPTELVQTVNKALGQERNLHTPWKNDKMNVLIPMAGAGSRFEQAGYTFPKPLIEVNGKPMIQTVVENLNIDAHYIFLVQKVHYEKYNLKYLLNLLKPGCSIVQVDGVTEGAACTTLLAKHLITDGPLLLANSDQYVEWNSSDFIYSCRNVDGGILTFESTHPKWSYAKSAGGLVTEVAEKKPISNKATVGIYLWNHGTDYVKYAEQMIEKNIRVNNEFYVCPVFNEAINDGKRFKTFNIDKMWGTGTPEDLDTFLKR